MVVEDSAARLAVLIDAENAALWAVEPLLAEIARYGKVQVKRAYGDWSTGSLKIWKRTLLDQSIRPVQVFAAVKGKNAADIALVIDTMDLLHSGAFDGFCLVSSDSDFTRLAERIREAGLTVYGFGEEKKTNPGLVAACNIFVFVETLATPPPSPAGAAAPAAPAQSTVPARPSRVAVPAQATVTRKVSPKATMTPEAPIPGAVAETSQTDGFASTKKIKSKANTKATAAASPARATTAQLVADTALIGRLGDAVATNAGPDGWTHLSAIGQAIRRHPAITLRTYGYSRLKDLLVASDLFELQQRDDSRPETVYARAKRAPTTTAT